VIAEESYRASHDVVETLGQPDIGVRRSAVVDDRVTRPDAPRCGSEYD